MSEMTLLIAESVDEIIGREEDDHGTDETLLTARDGSEKNSGEESGEKDGGTENSGEKSGEKDGGTKNSGEKSGEKDSGDKGSAKTSSEKSSSRKPESGNESADQSGDPGAEGSSADRKSGDESTESAGGTVSQSDAEEKTAEHNKDTEPDIFYYYYTKISREERLLYDALLALAQNYSTGSSAEESRLLNMNPSTEEFAVSYTRAYNALVSDHPELFWVAQAKVKYECKYYVLPSFGGKFKVVLTLTDDTGGKYDQNDCRDEQARLEDAAYALLGQVDFTQSDADIALQLHDLLISSAWYNTDAGEYDYAHTAYGALVEDSDGNPGGALCDGYALAYEYLMQRAGLTCIMIAGYAGPSEGNAEKHAWNLIKLDEDWYEVDPTWDDLDFKLSPTEDGYDLFLEAVSDEDYMNRIRHYMFNLTTEEIRSFTPGDEYTYVSHNGWVTLLQPSVHIRSSAEDSEVTRDYVTPLAPVAKGTWYTWDMLTGQE